uniref:Thyroxine-binding globulin n=1 Tax=Sinocyclocheilus grahami TaxID=75366 RepID=A0A672KR20_SINGR
ELINYLACKCISLIALVFFFIVFFLWCLYVILNVCFELCSIFFVSKTALYASNKLKLLPEFLKEIKEFYHSDGFTVDFSVKETLDKINTYVKEKTRGENRPNPFKNVTLSSKGKWDMPFNPSRTRQSRFHVDAETTVPVQMMHQYESLKVYYDVELTSKVLCLDYNNSFSMFLAVPDIHWPVKTIKDLEMAISRQHIEKWRTAVRRRNTDIYVPKLSLKTSYSLKDILKGMGMADMFTDKADFTGISEEKMLISKALHKASLDLDEKGTTAAAVTTVDFRLLSYSPLDTLSFDRPFMIFITDQKNDNILFFGKVVNPEEKQYCDIQDVMTTLASMCP